MRKVLAIIVALTLAAVVLSPAMGYTIKSEGNQSYSIGSTKVNYSISTGTPAQDITPSMIPPEVAPTSAVKVTQVPYSIKLGNTVPYSMKLESGAAAAAEGAQTQPQTEALGAAAKTAAATPEQPVAAATPEPTPAPVAKFSIMGMVFDDVNGNGAKDTDETGLAGWMINLEQPAGTVIANATTSEAGNYSFSDLNPGEYVVSEVLTADWSAVAPADGKYPVNLTDSDVKDINFAVKKVVAEVAAPPANVTATENTTATTNSTIPV